MVTKVGLTGTTIKHWSQEVSIFTPTDIHKELLPPGQTANSKLYCSILASKGMAVPHPSYLVGLALPYDSFLFPMMEMKQQERWDPDWITEDAEEAEKNIFPRWLPNAIHFGNIWMSSIVDG